jgi:hypothetical protein
MVDDPPPISKRFQMSPQGAERHTSVTGDFRLIDECFSGGNSQNATEGLNRPTTVTHDLERQLDPNCPVQGIKQARIPLTQL